MSNTQADPITNAPDLSPQQIAEIIRNVVVEVYRDVLGAGVDVDVENSADTALIAAVQIAPKPAEFIEQQQVEFDLQRHVTKEPNIEINLTAVAQSDALATVISDTTGGSGAKRSDVPTVASVEPLWKRELRKRNKSLEKKMDLHYNNLRKYIKKKMKIMKKSFNKKLTKLHQSIAQASADNSHEFQHDLNQDANMQIPPAMGLSTSLM